MFTVLSPLICLQLAQWAFSLNISNSELGESLHFIAPSDNDCYMWTDGINALLGNPVSRSQDVIVWEVVLEHIY